MDTGEDSILRYIKEYFHSLSHCLYIYGYGGKNGNFLNCFFMDYLSICLFKTKRKC